jgi:hypothetical protein
MAVAAWQIGRAAMVCGAEYGEERGAARDWGGCNAAALEKATTSGLALPTVRSLALEKGATLSFFFRSRLASGAR